MLLKEKTQYPPCQEVTLLYFYYQPHILQTIKSYNIIKIHYQTNLIIVTLGRLKYMRKVKTYSTIVLLPGIKHLIHIKLKI